MWRLLFTAILLCSFIVTGEVRAELPGEVPALLNGDETAAAEDELLSPLPVRDTSTADTKPPAASTLPFDASQDPAVNSWGNFRHPVAPAPTNEVGNYWLTPPPEGFLQHDTEPYEKTVASPDDVFHETACPPVIDLYRPDGLAPIGVIGDHLLNGGGQVLVSYRYSHYELSGYRDGTSHISNSDVLGTFPVASTRQSIDKHLLLLEWGPTSDLTFLATLPFYQLTMNYTAAGAAPPSSSKTDPGDLTLMALYNLVRWDRHQLHLNLGFSAPVGLLQTADEVITPTSPDFNYQMRVSSGTWDFMPGLTYRGQNDCWTWGAQAMGTVRFGLNRFDYRLGDQVDLTTWISRRLTDCVSTSFRLDGRLWGDINGADPRLNPLLVPANNPSLQGGQRLDVLFGVNYYLPDGRLPGQRLSIEGGVPAYQHLNGPQLSTKWLLTAGWQMIF